MARPAPHPRKYEMMIVVAPTVTQDGLPAVVERVAGYVQNHGGTVESVTHDSPWGHRRLAYPIQKFRDAFYVLYYFHGQPRAIDLVDRDIRLDEVIIRHLIVRYDPLTERTGADDEREVDQDEAAPREEAAVGASRSSDAAAGSDDDGETDNGQADADEDGDGSDDDDDADAADEDDSDENSDGEDEENA